MAYISGKIEQPMDRHGFFMEPLSVTKDLNSMEISLAPPEEDKYTPRCVTTMDVENQIAVRPSFCLFGNARSHYRCAVFRYGIEVTNL